MPKKHTNNTNNIYIVLERSNITVHFNAYMCYTTVNTQTNNNILLYAVLFTLYHQTCISEIMLQIRIWIRASILSIIDQLKYYMQQLYCHVYTTYIHTYNVYKRDT